MQKFIKKNIEVQAIQYTGTPEDLDEFTNLGLNYSYNSDEGTLSIVTSKGEAHGVIGDYIMMSVTGEFDICSQDKFEKLYSAQDSEKVNIPESSSTKTDTEQITEMIPEKGRILKSLRKELIHIIIFYFLDFLLICFLPFITDVCVRRSIKTTVEYIYKDEIQRESKLLLEKTRLEAQAIIDQAKEEAEKEADKSFRKEMERLTNERVRK